MPHGGEVLMDVVVSVVVLGLGLVWTMWLFLNDMNKIWNPKVIWMCLQIINLQTELNYLELS